MPAQLVWSNEHHWDHPCSLVRGYGEMFHAYTADAPCPVDVPLVTFTVPLPVSRTYSSEAVLMDGERIVLTGRDGCLEVYDTRTRTRRPAGRLGNDDGLGTSICQASDGTIYAMGAIVGLRSIRLEGDRVIQRDDLGPEHGFETADPDTAYWGGLASSISSYGDVIAVGGFLMPRVEVLDLSGKLETVIGPEFTYQDRTYSFLQAPPSGLPVPRQPCAAAVEGVFVDRWQRIWVAYDVARLAVFNRAGECLYVASVEELTADEDYCARFNFVWGVDSRGWLWCNAGNAAYTIPELEPGLAPTLSSRGETRTGLEPMLGTRTDGNEN